MSGFVKPEEQVDWSEVEVAALLRERDSLREEVAAAWGQESRMQRERDSAELQLDVSRDVLASVRETVARMVGERDRARAVAARLEQELARAEGQLALSFRWFVFKESGSWWAALRSADGTIRGHWRSFKSRRKAVRFARRRSGEDL